MGLPVTSWTTGYVRRGETTTSSDARDATGAARQRSTCFGSSGTRCRTQRRAEAHLHRGTEAHRQVEALEISARVLGPDYAIIWQPKLITRSKFGTHHDSETWSITGKRLVAISETDAGMDLDEAMVKNLTGASTMAMRGLYRAKESQVPVTWTIVIGTNEEPNVEKWDDAIGRRVIKIPSGPSLETWEVDLDLEDKILESEAEGVLASLVAGCVHWHQLRSANGTGLDMPQAVAKATREFEEANDHVAEFIHACVDFGPDYSVPMAQVNRAYKTHRAGKETLGGRALYERIVAHRTATGHLVTKDHRNFYGLHLAEQPRVEPYQQRVVDSWKDSI